MMETKLVLAVLLACLLPTSACLRLEYVSREEMDKHLKQEATERASIDQYLRGLYSYLGQRECPSDLATVLKAIRRGCGVDAVPAVAGGQAAAKPPRIGTCSPEEFRDAVADYERANKTPNSFFRQLWGLQHEVFYLRDLLALDQLRQERLERFTAMPPFPDTQYYVITSPRRGLAEAEQRANWIIGQMVSRGIPRDKIPRPLTSHDFFSKLQKKDLSQSDRHIEGSPEPDDLHASVWVFRANCVTAD